jgi:transcriptional regulator with XRE-family HTH domain
MRRRIVKDSPDNLVYGKRIKHIREMLGLTQKDFAEKMKVARNTISEAESGITMPGHGLLMVLNEIYNVNPNYILLGIGEPFLDGSNINPNDLDFGDKRKQMFQLISDMSESPILRFTVLAYAEKYRLNHNDIIEMDKALNSKKTVNKTNSETEGKKNDDI